MTDEEYLEAQTQVSMLAAMMVNVDVEGLLDRARVAEGAAPVLDPTLWKAASEKFRALKRIAEAAARFKGAAVEFRNEMQRIEATHGAR